MGIFLEETMRTPLPPSILAVLATCVNGILQCGIEVKTFQWGKSKMGPKCRADPFLNFYGLQIVLFIKIPSLKNAYSQYHTFLSACKREIEFWTPLGV